MKNKNQYERIIWMHKNMKASGFTKEKFFHEFGLSLRTLQRDLDNLKIFFNAPIKKDTKGYIYADKTYDLPIGVLDDKQLSHLFSLIPYLDSIKQTPIYKTFVNLTQKLTEKETHANSSVSLNKFNNKEISLDPQIFLTIEKAITNSKTTQMKYFSLSTNQTKNRLIDPYHLYVFNDEFYLAAYCHENHEIRDFNLNRVEQIELTSHKFVKDFNEEEYFAKNRWGIVKGGKSQEVKLKIKNDSFYKITEDFPSRFKKVQIDKSWTTVTCKTNISNEFINWILTKHGEIVVLEPTEVRQRLLGVIKEINTNYQTATSHVA